MSLQVVQYAAPISVLCQRITRDMHPGGKFATRAGAFNPLAWRKTGALIAVEYNTIDMIGAIGEDDLPFIGLYDYSDDEKAFAGANTNPQSPPNLSQANNVTNVARIGFQIAVSRLHAGLWDPTGIGNPGMIDWVALIRDSIEHDDAGLVDATLNRTCLEPIYTKTREVTHMDVMLYSAFDVEYKCQPTIRGTRSDLMETQPT